MKFILLPPSVYVLTIFMVRQMMEQQIHQMILDLRIIQLVSHCGCSNHTGTGCGHCGGCTLSGETWKDCNGGVMGQKIIALMHLLVVLNWGRGCHIVGIVRVIQLNIVAYITVVTVYNDIVLPL